jgi:ferredoxin-NADP reductase
MVKIFLGSIFFLQLSERVKTPKVSSSSSNTLSEVEVCGSSGFCVTLRESKQNSHEKCRNVSLEDFSQFVNEKWRRFSVRFSISRVFGGSKASNELTNNRNRSDNHSSARKSPAAVPIENITGLHQG